MSAKQVVAYQGVEGAFSHIASLRFLDRIPVEKAHRDFISARQFADIFSAVCEERAHFGVVPIENSLAGSIHENFDLLLRYPVWVCGELYLRVEHQLLTLPEVHSLSEISRVYSHPQALAQCALFFDQHDHLEEVVYSDTARAAVWVAQSKNPSFAAIASKAAGERYGLKILEGNIEDDPHNYTRFLLICSEQKRTTLSGALPRKASLALTLAHRPGSLAGLLGKLANENCNLTKIESRPIHGRPFEYRFYLDLEFPTEMSEADVALMVQEFARELRVLGIYSREVLGDLLKPEVEVHGSVKT